MPAPPVQSQGLAFRRPPFHPQPAACVQRAPAVRKAEQVVEGIDHGVEPSSTAPVQRDAHAHRPPAAQAAPHRRRPGCGARRRRRTGGPRGARPAPPRGRSRCPSRRRSGPRCGRARRSAAPMGGRVSRDCASRNSSRDSMGPRTVRAGAAGGVRGEQQTEAIAVVAPPETSGPSTTPGRAARRQHPIGGVALGPPAGVPHRARAVDRAVRERRRVSRRTDTKWYQSPPAATYPRCGLEAVGLAPAAAGDEVADAFLRAACGRRSGCGRRRPRPRRCLRRIGVELLVELELAGAALRRWARRRSSWRPWSGNAAGGA